MMGDWIVGVFMRFESNGAAIMQRLSVATNEANATLLTQQGVIDKNATAMARYSRRIEEVRMAHLRLGTTVARVMTFVGIGGMVIAMKQAGELQRTMAMIQISTGANPRQMARLQQMAYDISNQTAQSVNQSARVMGVMATSGINNPNQLMRIAKPAAQFADVQFLSGKASFEEAAKQAIQLAHLYQAYTPSAITPILDKLTKLSFMMPDNLNRYLRQSSYYMPLFRRLNVPEDQSLVIGAFLDRMGLGQGKGGTAAMNFLMQSMNVLQKTAHGQTGHAAALGHLGLLNADGSPKFYRTNAKTGKPEYDLFAELQSINKLMIEQTKNLHGSALTRKSAEFIGDIKNAFGTQGSRFGYLATPQGIQQLLNMVGQLHAMPSMAADQRKLTIGTLPGSFQRAMSNLGSVLTTLGTPWLTDLTSFFNSLAKNANDFRIFLGSHQDITKSIGQFVAVFTTLAATRTVLGVLALSKAVMALPGAIQIATDRILMQEVILGGGSVAGAAPRVVKGAGLFERMFKGIDTLLFASFGSTLIKWHGSIGKFGVLLLKPLAMFGGWVAKIGKVIGFEGALSENTMLGAIGRLVAGLGGAVGIIADLGGLISRAFGPISALLSLSGDSNNNPYAMPVPGAPMAAWSKWQHFNHLPDTALPADVQHTLFAQRTKGLGHSVVIQMHDTNIVMPKGTPQDQAKHMLLHLMNLGGVSKTTHNIPAPFTLASPLPHR